MDRIVFMVLRNIYRAPFWFYRVVKMGREDAACTEQERYGYIRRMVEEINRTGRVTIRVQGRENLPEQDEYIYQSSPGFHETCRHYFRYG